MSNETSILLGQSRVDMQNCFTNYATIANMSHKFPYRNVYIYIIYTSKISKQKYNLDHHFKNGVKGTHTVNKLLS